MLSLVLSKDSLIISLGCDPGKQGAVSIVDLECKEITFFKLAESPRALNIFLQDNWNVHYSTLEKISPRTGWNIHSMVKLFGSYMSCFQAMHLLECDTSVVTPHTWQKPLGLVCKRPPGLSDTKYKTYKKNIHKDRLKEILELNGFTAHGITHTTADATLIAFYRLHQEGFISV